MNSLNLNLSASLNIFKLVARPALCLPQQTISTFADLPIPLDSNLRKQGTKADIRAVVLDKDDCFAYPHAHEVYKPYRVSQKKCAPTCMYEKTRVRR